MFMEEVMKLRIKGDSLRLRVSRSELNCLLRGGTNRRHNPLFFGSGSKADILFENAARDASTGIRYSAGHLKVLLSKDDVQTWGDPSQVGIYTSVENRLREYA